MKLLSDVSKLVLSTIIEKPGSAAGLAVFGLGFALVASNALYSQEGTHPDPMWSTAKDQESLSEIQEPRIAKVNYDQTITRSVLTQRISLSNIPVPTAKPTRSAKVSSHTSLVRDVQSTLFDIGYYTGKIDGIYGSGTRAAIKTFQKRAGIIPNGEASYELLNQLHSVQSVTRNYQQSPQVVSKPVQPSESTTLNAEMVARVQVGLKENFGIENISIDGVLGSQTKTAVKLFQERFKLDATGELDASTIQKMRSVGILTSI